MAREGAPKYLRGVAWLRLLKVWAVLPYDSSWLAPPRPALVEGPLTANYADAVQDQRPGAQDWGASAVRLQRLLHG